MFSCGGLSLPYEVLRIALMLMSRFQKHLRDYRTLTTKDAQRKANLTKRELRYRIYDAEYCFDRAKALLEAEGKEISADMQEVRDTILPENRDDTEK